MGVCNMVSYQSGRARQCVIDCRNGTSEVAMSCNGFRKHKCASQ